MIAIPIKPIRQRGRSHRALPGSPPEQADGGLRDPWASIMADLLELRREARVLREEFGCLGADADQLGLQLRLAMERSRQL